MFIKTYLLPSKIGAITLGPVILIRPKYADDPGYQAHELTHQKRQYKYLIIFWWILYLLSSSFRMREEVAAYKVQISYGNLNVTQAAHYLSTIYWLGISQEEAEKLLTD